jgi:hypothetical protein
MAGADLVFAEHEGGENPAALDGFFDVRREVGNRGGTARQAIQGRGDVGGEFRGIDFEMTDDAVQIGILRLQKTVAPSMAL